MKNDLISEKLKSVSFFLKIADDKNVVEKIASMCRPASFKKGKRIISEGNFGQELFIVMEGEVDIIKNTLQNEEYTVATISADNGSIAVGEQGLIDNDRRSASVVARTDCSCVVIYREDFIKFGDENPKAGLLITREIAKKISSNLRKANSDVITLFSALVHEIENT